MSLEYTESRDKGAEEMYLAITERGGRQYASAAVSRREGARTHDDYTYLGRVVDRERGIFCSRERGYFTFDVATGEFGRVPDGFVPDAPEDGRRSRPRTLSFGDAWLVDQLMARSGMWDVVDEVPWSNRDTLHAMVAFYVCSRLANCHAEEWWRTSVASLLWPKARLDSQGVSEFLERVGSRESVLAFQEAYARYVLDEFDGDTNVMIDSTGLPNKSGMYLTRVNVHEGKVNVEARLAIVAQRSTSIHLWWQLLPGSVNDAMSFRRILAHCEGVGIHVDSCLIDAGYCTDANLDELYDGDHVCVTPYVTRPKSSAKWLREALPDALEGIRSRENFVRYGDRYLFVRRVPVKVGKGRDQPAWLYVGIDESRLSDELHKLLVRARRRRLAMDQVYEGLERQGVFCLLSGTPHEVEEILPEYYVRQGIEQLNDVAKGYTKLLPTRCHTVETFTGHVLLSMMGNSLMRFVQIRLNDSEMYLSSRMEALRSQGCILYKGRLVPDEPIQPANEVYQAFRVEVPTTVPIRDGAIAAKPPKRIAHLFTPPKRKRGKNGGKLAFDAAEVTIS